MRYGDMPDANGIRERGGVARFWRVVWSLAQKTDMCKWKCDDDG